LIRRTVFEWQRIAYGDTDDRIPEWAADRVAAVARKSPLGGEGGARVLAHGRRDLRAGQVVGVLAAEGCALEILPKIDGLGDGETDGSRGLIRQKLVHMLAVVLDLEISSGAMTQLGWQRENLLEILIGLFADKLTDAVRQGMPRRYVGCEEDLPALRGRLDVIRQFTKHAAAPQRLACRYDTLSTDVALNRIMKAAVVRLLRVSRAPDNMRKLRELGFAYA
jgi:5-methylcytosine-specific restriction enzyme subunit McrC